MNLNTLCALALLGGCTAPVVQMPEVSGSTISSRFEGNDGQGGVLVVHIAVPPGAVPEVPEPSGEGLSLQAMGAMDQEQVGSRQLLTWRWSVSGSAGSYEIAPVDLRIVGLDEPVDSAPSLFIDLEVEPPREGEWVDIADPGVVRVIPWAWLFGVGTVATLSLAGVVWAFRRPRVPGVVEIPEEAPDVVVLRGWASVHQDDRLDDYTKALALSRLFRDYLEAVLTFPATAWTTTETVAHLRELAHLDAEHVPQARRLLRATDRVKYAETKPKEDLFEVLTEDLLTFVDATRPHRWDEEPS
jgi:hypothetical protein